MLKAYAVRKKVLFFLALGLILAGCGGGTPYSPDVVTDSPPTLARVDPAQGAAGSQVTIFGFGFSIEAPNNVVVIGNQAVAASQYTFLANPTGSELESITFTVPADLAAGVYALVVLVDGQPSNVDQTFEVL